MVVRIFLGLEPPVVCFWVTCRLSLTLCVYCLPCCCAAVYGAGGGMPDMGGMGGGAGPDPSTAGRGGPTVEEVD